MVCPQKNHQVADFLLYIGFVLCCGEFGQVGAVGFAGACQGFSDPKVFFKKTKASLDKMGDPWL